MPAFETLATFQTDNINLKDNLVAFQVNDVGQLIRYETLPAFGTPAVFSCPIPQDGDFHQYRQTEVWQPQFFSLSKLIN